MKLFHATSLTAARSILETGFKDGRGTYGTDRVLVGVFFADAPLDENDFDGDAESVLVVDIPESEVESLEITPPGRFREFLVPAQLANRYPVRMATDEERYPAMPPVPTIGDRH